MTADRPITTSLDHIVERTLVLCPQAENDALWNQAVDAGYEWHAAEAESAREQAQRTFVGGLVVGVLATVALPYFFRKK
jgi:hypothetical protein